MYGKPANGTCICVVARSFQQKARRMSWEPRACALHAVHIYTYGMYVWYVCMYVCMCLYTHIHIHIHKRISIYICVAITNVQTYMDYIRCACIYSYTCAYIHVYIYIYIYPCIIHMFTYI